MANQKIVLAELDLDIKGLIAAAQQSKEAIAAINRELANLKAAGQDSSAQFVKMQQDIKMLTQLLASQNEAIKDQLKHNKNLATAQSNLATAIDKTTIAQQNLATNMEANNNATQEYAENATDAAQAVTTLNEALDQNSTLMGDTNNSTQTQVKTMNDYKQQVIDSFNSISVFNGGLSGILTRAQEAGGVLPLLKGAFEGISGGIKGMGQAIMTNPLGLLLQLVAPIIEQLKNFAPLTNAVEQAMAALSPVIDLVTAPIKLLAEGITWVVKGFAELVGSMSDSAGEALKLTQAQQQLTTQMALQESANEKAKQQTDELIKKSQDHTLSEQERAEAIDDATKIQLKNYNERKAIADKTFAIEYEKLMKSKDISFEEMKILEEGTAAEVNKLMNTKNISKEELEVYEKAKVEKMRIATEEEGIKESQAAAIKTITDELIKKSEDQTLSEQERLDALKEAVKIEGELLARRKKEADADYNNAVTLSKLRLGVTQDDIDGLLKEGDAYKDKARLVNILSKTEVEALIKAGNEKKRLSRENIQLNEKEAAAIKTIKDEERKEKEATTKKEVAEAVSQQQKIAGERVKTLQLEMQLYVQQNESKKRTYEEELSYIKEIERRKKAIAEESFRATDKTHNDFLSKKLALGEIEKEAAKSNADAEAAHNKKIADDNMAAAKAAHDKVIEANNEILTKNKTLNDTLVSQEKARLDAVAVADKAYAQQKFDNKVISQTELNAEITRIDTESAEAKKTLDQELSDTEAAKKLEELEAKKVDKETAFLDNLAIEQEQDDIKRAQELSNVNLTAEDKEEINKKYDDAATAREKSKNDYIANSRAQLFESIKGLFSKESKIGKAIAVAEIANTTVKNASAAFQQAAVYSSNPLTIPLAVNAAIQGGIIVATGAAQIKKTVGAKFEDGGLVTVGGNRHSNGGTLFTGADGTRFEAEQGELIGVMNRNAAAHFMAFNNAFPAGGSSAPNYFASGGIVSREMAQPGLNIDELAAKIAVANASIPAPVVAVQDIISQGNSYVRVRDAANF